MRILVIPRQQSLVQLGQEAANKGNGGDLCLPILIIMSVSP
jgi:hypothetical protein